jgi:hypothetical protein
MPQDDLLIKLRARGYSVMELGDSSWNVMDGPSILGTIGFTNGKLSYVSKSWGPQEQKKGVEFARAVFGLIAHLEEEGKTLCLISTATSHDPNGQSDGAFMTCGQKYIELRVVRIDRGDFTGEYASISETLRTPE